MQDGIPIGNGDEKAGKLSQDLRGEDEQQDDDLQRIRQLNAEVLLDEKRQDEKRQHQQADKGVFIFSAQDGGYQRSKDDQAQHQIYRKYLGLPPDRRAQVAGGFTNLLALFHRCGHSFPGRFFGL